MHFLHFSIILCNIFHIVHISFIPDNLSSLLFFICLELLPLQLLVLLVFNFNLREYIVGIQSLSDRIVHFGNIQVPEDIVNSCVQERILMSNPILDPPYNLQDVQNMLALTTRSHKDSEDLVYHMDDSRHYLSSVC